MNTINRVWILNLLLAGFIIFFTFGCKTDVTLFTDIDGNPYQTVKIGNQTWMVENLKTTKFNDGTVIPSITDSISWNGTLAPGYCFYNNDSLNNKKTYGALYNWYAVNSGKLAPKGWHVPSDAEWTILINYVSNKYSSSCSAAKTLALNSNWKLDESGCSVGNDLSKNNGSGFSAYPAGIRNFSPCSYADLDISGNWWSSTQMNSGSAWKISLYTNYSDVSRGSEFMQNGMSVRCIKD